MHSEEIAILGTIAGARESEDEGRALHHHLTSLMPNLAAAFRDFSKIQQSLTTVLGQECTRQDTRRL